MATHYRATFTSDRRNVALARRSVASFATMCGFGDNEVADIRLAVGEALSNAVEHGKSARSSGFTVTCSYEEEELSIDIRDSGPGFSAPAEAPCVEPDERGRGYGIFLMRRLMDSVTFSRNGTVVHLVRRRTDPPAQMFYR